jgi:ABC-type metal ion transport system substrate-binding protein
MLRKILITLVVISMAVTFGCKKTSTETETKNTVQIKQTEKDGQTTTETVKKETIKETETALKDANAQ